MPSLMEFVPAPGVLATYTLACFVLFITPGPDMSLFLAKTITGGRRAGLLAMLGTMAGCCIHTVLAAIGVSALLAASETAFMVLKIVGAGYLLWLAVDAVRHGSALRLRDTGRQELSAWRTFLLGFGVNLTNPKIVLFFVTFLPQFVNPGNANAAGQLLFLGLYFVVFSTPLAALLVLGAERTIGILTRHPRVMRGIDYTFAGVFGIFALRIATMPGR
ncbi:LysE family translocator [Enterovirga sp. CN4-39]|uniref:LysE family translocator n=1 Tax=Enterovirga sp. CN4-39 TaxID=3400910 RepID=UPI003C10BCA6